jgi:hypothetical protein
MTALCSLCGHLIEADGYCGGCGMRPPGPAADEERRARHLTIGCWGTLALGTAALVLFGHGATAENFLGFGADHVTPAGLRWWWVGGLGTALLLTAAWATMTGFCACAPARLFVWFCLLTAWMFGGWLGFQSARAAGSALTSSRSSAAAAESRIASLRDERDREIEAYQERTRLAGAAPEMVLRLGARDPVRLVIDRIDRDHRRAVDQLIIADSLAWQAGTLLAAAAAAMAAVVLLLFLVAAEQGWAAVTAPGPAPAR